MAAEAAAEEAARRGVAPVISAVDAGGALMFLVRPDLAQVASVEVTTDKARTAAIYRRPSKDFEDQAVERPPVGASPRAGRPAPGRHPDRARRAGGRRDRRQRRQLRRRGRRAGRDRRPRRVGVAGGGMNAAATRTWPARGGRARARPAGAAARPPGRGHRPAVAAGCALVGGQWRYADARVREVDFVELGGPGSGDPLGPGDVPNRTYDIEPHAEAVDFDDSTWMQLAPAETMRRLAGGRVCFNWYRIAVTVPERVGDLDPTGATVVFEVVVDDYAEIWVDGKLPLALGDGGGQVVARLQRSQPGDPHPRRPARPAVRARGVRHQRADLGLAAQLHLDAHRVARVPPAARPEPADDRARRRRRSSSPKVRSGRPTARSCSARPTPTPSTASSRSASASPCSGPRAAMPASTSAATTNPAPTASRSRPMAC